MCFSNNFFPNTSNFKTQTFKHLWQLPFILDHFKKSSKLNLSKKLFTPISLSLQSLNLKRAHLISLFAIFLFVVYSSACASTSGSTTPTTTASPSGCCPALVQTNTSNTNFIDGFMTFVYNSDTCRTSVTATCTS